jgi:hypothetical protein
MEASSAPFPSGMTMSDDHKCPLSDTQVISCLKELIVEAQPVKYASFLLSDFHRIEFKRDRKRCYKRVIGFTRIGSVSLKYQVGRMKEGTPLCSLWYDTTTQMMQIITGGKDAENLSIEVFHYTLGGFNGDPVDGASHNIHRYDYPGVLLCRWSECPTNRVRCVHVNNDSMGFFVCDRCYPHEHENARELAGSFDSINYDDWVRIVPRIRAEDTKRYIEQLKAITNHGAHIISINDSLPMKLTRSRRPAGYGSCLFTIGIMKVKTNLFDNKTHVIYYDAVNRVCQVLRVRKGMNPYASHPCDFIVHERVAQKERSRWSFRVRFDSSNNLELFELSEEMECPVCHQAVQMLRETEHPSGVITNSCAVCFEAAQSIDTVATTVASLSIDDSVDSNASSSSV